MSGDESPEGIARQLEEDIVLGAILPRERLPEDLLMARFGAKRHVIRSALKLLATTGVLEHVPNKGAQVRAFDEAELRDLYALRDMLETAAAMAIPLPLAPEAEASLRALQADHDAAVAAHDPARIFRANIAFHRAFFALCPNPFLVEAIETASARAHTIRFAALRNPAAAEASRLQHHAMIEAARRADRTTLARLFQEHLPASREAYLQLAPAPLTGGRS